MEKKKISLRFIFLIVFLIILGSLILNYYVNRKNPLSFAPVKYNLMVQTPPLKTIYENYLPLEVVDIALSDPSSFEARKFIFMLRDNQLLKNFFFKELINIPIIMVMENKKSSLFIFDLKWRSIITKILPFIGYNLDIKNLSIIKQGKLLIFKLSGNPELYFSIVENVLLFSFDIKTIENAYSRLKSKENFLEKKSKRIIQSLSRDSKTNLKILISPEDLLKEFSLDSDTTLKLLKKLKFNEEALLDIILSEDKISISLDLPLYSDEVIIQKMLSTRFNYINSIKFIPEQVSLISIINFTDLKNLVDIVKAIEITDVETPLSKADSMVKTLFGKNLDNLIFSWIGSEIGVFKSLNSKESIFFIKIKNEQKYKEFIDTVLKGLIIENANPIQMDDIIINQIRIADFLSFLLGIFNINIPTAYYISLGNYFFLSFEADNLKEIIKNFKEKKSFYETKNFKELSKNFSLYSGLWAYYNTEAEKPFFIQKESILMKILGTYGNGVISLSQSENKNLRFNLTALNTKKGLNRYIGYPKTIEIDLNKSIFLKELNEPVFVYSYNDTLKIQNVDLNTIFKTNFNEDIEILLDEKSSLGKLYVIMKDSRKLISLDIKVPNFVAKEIENIDFTFTPFIYKDNIYYFSEEQNKFYRINTKNLSKEEIPLPQTENPVLSRPYFKNEYWAYYEKSFEGKAYFASDFKLKGGWPVMIEGLATGSPLIIFDRGLIKIFFITQAGKLYGWNSEGNTLSSLPIEIDDSFSEQLNLLNSKGTQRIIGLSKNGTIYIFDTEGNMKNKIKLNNIEAGAKLSIYDINKDESDEIFVYNNQNNISAYKYENDELIEVEGFPIKGWTKPDFYDLNKDGKIEVISAGLDGKLHIYTYSKK
ncbi:MAG: VCBS repeat-containing protein [Brevinematales bacterium]|nr:VCBS repeat-containing protein [Brevinematales bacterium]